MPQPTIPAGREVLVASPVRPIVKWPGGKTRELGQILPRFPDDVDRLLEPFVGGGAVLFATDPAVPAIINDASPDLIGLYRAIADRDDDLHRTLADFLRAWEAIGQVADIGADALETLYRDGARGSGPGVRRGGTRAIDAFLATHADRLHAPLETTGRRFLARCADALARKAARMAVIETRRGPLSPGDVHDNLEGALKAALYTHARALYNHAPALSSGVRAAVFWFVRENAYAAMFRFNAAGGFNVPYGGVSYNRKDLRGKVDRLADNAVVGRLRAVTMHCGDFSAALDAQPSKPGDLIFLDPPYDSDFRDYDGLAFGAREQERLAQRLLSPGSPRFLLVTQATPLIENLYRGRGLVIESFATTYAWTIKQRNERRATHLVIRNYGSAD